MAYSDQQEYQNGREAAKFDIWERKAFPSYRTKEWISGYQDYWNIREPKARTTVCEECGEDTFSNDVCSNCGYTTHPDDIAERDYDPGEDF